MTGNKEFTLGGLISQNTIILNPHYNDQYTLVEQSNNLTKHSDLIIMVQLNIFVNKVLVLVYNIYPYKGRAHINAWT